MRVQSRTISTALVMGAVCTAAFWACGPGYPDQVNGSFDFTKHAFLFANFDDAVSGAGMTAPLAARMFGDEAVCLSGAAATCQPRAGARVWLDDVNTQLRFGHSEGMAVLALLMSMGKVKASDFGAATAAELSLDEGGLRAELAYWAATQKLQAAHARDKKLTAKEALLFLSTALPDASEGWRLLLAVRDASGFHAGHSVVPFGYFRGEAKGQYFIRIYDPNFPGEERRIEVDTEANSWKYEGSPNADQPRSYEGTAANGNLLYFSPVSARLGTFTAPFVDGFSASASGTVFVEGDGAQVGFKDGQPVENGGTLMPGAADCFCKPPTGITNVMVAGNGAKTVSVGADAGTVFAMSSTVAAKVEPQGAAAVTVDPAAKTVTYNSTADGGTTLTTTTKNADGSETTVTVTLDKKATGVTIDASDPKNVKILADVTTSTTNVTVTTTVTTPSGATSTTTSSGKTMGGKDIAFTVDTSSGTTTVNNNVNYAVCLNGKKDPMESDVDCGDFCHTADEHSGDGRCAPTKRCSKNEDCSYTLAQSTAIRDVPGECISGSCSPISCEDGRKNGPETDVDCWPGSNFCRCGEGQSCERFSDCREGRYCINVSSDGGSLKQCHVPTPHTLTTVGIGTDQATYVSMALDGDPARSSGAFNSGAFNVNAYQSLVVKWEPAPYNEQYLCTFDSANARGEWVWNRSTNPAAFTNTLRCKRAAVELKYDSRGEGCPPEVYIRTDAGTITEYRPQPPGLVFTSLHPSVTIENYSTIITQGYYPTKTGNMRLTGPYDGGLAWSVAVQPPVEGNAFYFPYNYDDPRKAAAAKLPPPGRWRYACQVLSADSGVFDTTVITRVTCSCTQVQPPDGGVDAGFDGGVDAGRDAGVDAGFDAGFDAGSVDAGSGPKCTTDSDCGSSADCYCGDSSGNCAGNSGHCGAGKFVSLTPTTDGVAASGTFTVPANCWQVKVDAWGAAGGSGEQNMGFPIPSLGGAGGYVTGILSVDAGEKFTAWIGAAGDKASLNNTAASVGSYLGVAANGGTGDGTAGMDTGGGGGGLTSLLHAKAGGAQINAFLVPGGGGSGNSLPGKPAGDVGSGDLTTRAGGAAMAGSVSGGGGAGEKGGSAGMTGAPGIGGSFGPLPAGFTSVVGDVAGTPGGSSLEDYATRCSTPGKGVTVGTPGNGCVVVRCLP